MTNDEFQTRLLALIEKFNAQEVTIVKVVEVLDKKIQALETLVLETVQAVNSKS